MAFAHCGFAVILHEIAGSVWGSPVKARLSRIRAGPIGFELLASVVQLCTTTIDKTLGALHLQFALAPC